MNWIFSRITEPSSHAGLAAASQLLKVVAPAWGAVFDAATGLFSALAFALTEKKAA